MDNSAEELTRQLEEDTEPVSVRAAREGRFAERASRVAADEASILADLAAAGVQAISVYDFIGKRAAPEAALPVLVRHLNVEHLPVVREGIIRALGLPRAREIALERLCAEYITERDPNLQWVIANALSGMARLQELSRLPNIESYEALFK